MRVLETCGAPYFDQALGAWVLSRFSDVEAALADPRLAVGAAPPKPESAGRASFTSQSGARPTRRERAADDSARASALTLLRAVPDGGAIDLVTGFAAPWCLALAARHSDISIDDAACLVPPAETAFHGAAHATSGDPSENVQRAIGTVARGLAAGRTLQPLDVQGFVALTQTLPLLLGAAWYALLTHPAQAEALRAQRKLEPAALDELLRFAGPSRAVFRRACERMVVGGAMIEPGDRVVLQLSSANHDPARFVDAERLDFERDARGHLAFGRGAHRCVGAAIVRTALAIATEVLLSATRAIALDGEVEWLDGFAIRGVAWLPVRLRFADARSGDPRL